MEEITPNASSIKSLASKSGSKEITPQGELDLGIEIERDIGGKFRHYLDGKVKKGDLPPSMAQLALDAIEQKLLPGG